VQQHEWIIKRNYATEICSSIINEKLSMHAIAVEGFPGTLIDIED